MADPETPIAQLRVTCSDKNKTCCSKYSNTVDKSLFNPSVIGQQTDNVLCDIGDVKNIDTKCLELCQTNPDCVAYSTSTLSCNLYNQVSPNTEKIDPLTGKEITSTVIDYYTKK